MPNPGCQASDLDLLAVQGSPGYITSQGSKILRCENSSMAVAPMPIAHVHEITANRREMQGIFFYLLGIIKKSRYVC